MTPPDEARPPEAPEAETEAGAPRTATFLRDIWYYAMPGDGLKRGRMVGKTICGEPLLVGRDAKGGVFALLDICPHRGIPLTDGFFDGREVECCYHGWRFGTDGRCRLIPSLVDGYNKLNPDRIRVRHFPCRESQHGIWVFLPAGREAPDEADLPALPELPDVGETPYKLADTVRFPCHIDHAVIGLMDPAHGPFVHQAWWWRQSWTIHEKSKAFEPSELGFRMVRHRPSSNSRAYRLLGGTPETEITFRLPGVRVEHIRAGPRHVVGLTAVTPVTETETEINHVIYWDVPLLSVIRPFGRVIARAFLNQDKRIVERQQRGLRFDPQLMLIDDADTQAKWYFRLKKAYAEAVDTGTPFVNPVTARTLRWRS